MLTLPRGCRKASVKAELDSVLAPAKKAVEPNTRDFGNEVVPGLARETKF